MENKNNFITEFGDFREVRRKSNVIDVSKLGFFDELEYEVWDVVLKYMKKFNIEIDDNEIDFYTAKEIQECILKQFTYAGFEFKYEREE